MPPLPPLDNIMTILRGQGSLFALFDDVSQAPRTVAATCEAVNHYVLNGQTALTTKPHHGRMKLPLLTLSD